MTHLFISYASADQAIAMEVCALLEARGVSCWIAPRDVAPGSKWDEAIVGAIREARAFLLILTHAANESAYVSNEVNHAFAANKSIFTLRAEDVTPGKSLEFYLGRHHWIDGFDRPLDETVALLTSAVSAGIAGSTVPGAVGTTTVAPVTPKRAAVAHVSPRRISPGAASGVAAITMLLTASGTLMWQRYLAPAAPRQSPVHLSVALPENTEPQYLALSPDGRMLVFADSGRLFVRSLESDDIRELGAARTLGTPFWSADSRTVAFFDRNQLKTVSASGGPAQAVCDGVGFGRGGTWSGNGTIVFATQAGVLVRVAAGGGPCTPLGKPDAATQRWLPVFLPDGMHFLYILQSADDKRRGLYIASLDEPDGHRLLADLSSAVVVPDSAGARQAQLLFTRNESLMAVSFDTSSLQIAGDPIVVAHSVSYSAMTPQVAATASASGTIAYVVNGRPQRQLTWYDRSGKEMGRAARTGTSGSSISLAPDGGHVNFVRVSAEGTPELWIQDLKRQIETRVAATLAVAGAVWSPDARRVALQMTGAEGAGIYTMPVDGGAAQLLLSGANLIPSDWSRDGWLAYTVNEPESTGADIWMLPNASDTSTAAASRKPFPWYRTPSTDTEAQISPDGRWIAYTSAENVTVRVYLRRFTGKPVAPSDARWQVSSGEAEEPRWSRDGRELFYTEGAGPHRVRLMSAAIGDGANPVGAPRMLFEVTAARTLPQVNASMYSPAADGQHFLVNAYLTQAQPSMDVILNWPASLRR